uniref:receptor-like protein EIX2 n=1 Tax=Erigeron canadensis TaxID=72917 RepID=UPI001CB97D61|nr:receptor-like protein EIX2 [Erigeron canadensis]
MGFSRTLISLAFDCLSLIVLLLDKVARNVYAQITALLKASKSNSSDDYMHVIDPNKIHVARSSQRDLAIYDLQLIFVDSGLLNDDYISAPFGTSSNTMMMMTSSNVTCIERERESLLTFKRTLSDGLNRLSTWTGVECCEWQGVGCDKRNGHVVKLDLRTPVSSTGDYDFVNTDNWISGEVSSSLLNLNHLRYLDMSLNNFTGQIPEFLGSFKYLEYLNLSFSGFSGIVPHHLGNLSRLQYLDLSMDRYYYLSYIPGPYYYDSPLLVDDIWWVSSISSLKHLDLSGISIGEHTDWFHSLNMLPSLLKLKLAFCDINYIPSIKFINFTSLNSLDLSKNGMDSTIPVWLSNLTELIHLNLYYNNFHGRIPDHIGTLSSLAFIDLSSNSFDSSLPVQFSNLSSLVFLDLSYNMFHGLFPSDVTFCNLSIIVLSENNFAEDLPSFIRNMLPDCLRNSLKDLDLRGNQFSGSIPDKFGEYRKLEHLILSENTLSGPMPSSLGGLSSLRVLDFFNNSLSGNIPTTFGLLSSLEELILNSNQLSGIIPGSLGLLSRLEKLNLAGNHFLSGNVPTSLGQLSNLEYLDVSWNSLVGELSENHFTRMKNLTFLHLTSNSLRLNVSFGWIPPFQLQHFDASFCNIGPQFPNWLQTQENLEQLYLSNSSIRDMIPEWFENVSSHIWYLDLSHNQIYGKLPKFHNTKYLFLNSNKFEGSFDLFPSYVINLELSDNLLSGHVPYTNATTNPDLNFVKLSNNRLTGSFPVHLCKVLSILVLDLSNNKFSGVFPPCLGNLSGLESLDLSENNITGALPSSLGYLPQLMSLHLYSNRLEGNLPTSLQNSTKLVTMDLGNNLFTGNIPLWIGEKLLNLRTLTLQLNKFMGKIPQQLCQLIFLQYLNLAHNNITGRIPLCFGNLSGMITNKHEEYYSGSAFYQENIWASTKGTQLQYTKNIQFLTSLDLSSNMIIGEIPYLLMNLAGLQNLNLSGNLLQGKIPVTIGNLKEVESLDLSMNKLTGPVPQSLTGLNFLSHLNLSFNNLSGPIPTGSQLQTLNDSSIYKGNIGLCGPPLSRSCKGNDSSYNDVEEIKGQDDTEGLWFYVGMGPGFAVGFIGLLGSLHFIKSWRIAYFETLEDVYGWLILSIQLNLARLRRKLF